jgi:hypothetical protein
LALLQKKLPEIYFLYPSQAEGLFTGRGEFSQSDVIRKLFALSTIQQMHKPNIRNLIFFLMELLMATVIGIVVRKFSEIYLFEIDFSYVLIFNYLLSTLGIAIPGYYYLKFYGNKEIFVGALFSALTFIFFGFIAFLLLGALNFSVVGFDNSGLIIPIIFGVIGFNIFAFGIKPN